MDDLQATIEIAVDLGRFYNVDLFQRGFYQVAVRLTEPAHPQAKVEVHILKTNDKDHFAPARVFDDGQGALSKCLQVLYKREECHLNHTFLFRIHCLLDSQKIMECLKKFNFQLEATLCFSSADDLPDDLTKCMEEVSKRSLKLELDLIYGLFANTLVLFDYGYMAAVEVTVHASLVALHQPLMTMPGIVPNSKTGTGVEPATLESILFRALPGMSVGQAVSYDVKVSSAISVHAKLVKILLTVYAHMQNYYLSLLKSIPRRHREGYGPVDVTQKLKDMTLALQDLHSLEEVVSQVNMNLASTCSLLLALWSHVLDTSCLNKQVRKQLGFKYHKHRVQRFQCGFFTTENPRGCPFDETRYGIYNWMASEIRSSRYFSELPVLPIHNEESDGMLDSLPVIFEDVYTHQCKKVPVFKKSAMGIFSRNPAASTAPPTKNPGPTQNGFLNISEEIGRVERVMESPNSSVSSCGEACEATVGNEKEENGSQKKKTKYPSIFRKRKGSYKPRAERLSVSDDESTKVTLAEFLSSIDKKSSRSTVMSKSYAVTSTNVPSKSKSHRKLKTSLSANDQNPEKRQKSKKRGSFSHHRRSLDEGAQRILQLVRLNKRNSDGVDQVADDKSLSRSYSSSILDQSKADSSSTSSSHTSLDASDDANVREDVTSEGQATSTWKGHASLRRGFTTIASRNAENRFRAQLRSETSEEPESGISEKTIAMTVTNSSMIKVTSTTLKKNPSPTPKSSNVVPPATTQRLVPPPLAAGSPARDLKSEQFFHGMVKSQSFSTGIERLQQGAEDPNEFPRPHTHLHATISCGPRLKTSHTTLGGLDRVRYGMGLHPGSSTMTTTDLSPFDEPELIQAWGELTTSSPQKTSELSQSSSDDTGPTEQNSLQPSDDDTLTPSSLLDLSTPNVVRPEPVKKQECFESMANGDWKDAGPNLKVGQNESKMAEFGSQNGLDDDAALPRVGALFFPDEMEGPQDPVQGSTLPQGYDDLMLKAPRSQSLRVLAGSLECSEEPANTELMNEVKKIEMCDDEKLRDMVFEPAPANLEEVAKQEVNHNCSPAQTSATNANTSNTVMKSSGTKMVTNMYKNKFNSSDKLNRTLGEVSLHEAEASLATSVELFNTIPPLRTQRERRHMAEKSKLFGRLHFPGFSYTDIPPPIPLTPYLTQRLSTVRNSSDDEFTGCHLVVCVHGLDGNSNDLRLVRTYIQLAVPSNTNISFLMSRANQDDTYADIDTMTEHLVSEILDHIHLNFSSGKLPTKISFIGHSLGCLLIRSVVAHDRMRSLRSRFHTFLSFSGPHLGTIFNNSALVNTGLWLIQKWKKSACLLQLACKDHADLRKTYIYKLSKKKGLEFFRNILLVASASDRYVPYHSARIEMCKQAFRDKTLGPPYQEMLNNIMKPVLNKQKLNLVRYHVVHALPSATANTMIGRAAHIAVLDSEVFLEKFLLVAGLRYFV